GRGPARGTRSPTRRAGPESARIQLRRFRPGSWADRVVERSIMLQGRHPAGGKNQEMSRESAKPMLKLPFTLLGLVLWLPRAGLPEDDTAKAAAKKPEESEAKEKGAKEKKEDAAGP